MTNDQMTKILYANFIAAFEAGNASATNITFQSLRDHLGKLKDRPWDWGGNNPLAVGTLTDLRMTSTGQSFLVHSFLSTDRYLFDVGLCKKEDGWLQYDTAEDAWYFGSWVNKERRMIVDYTEGDIYVIYCPSVDAFNAEIKAKNEFYDEGFICKTIGDEGMTTYVQDRDEFFIKEAE